MVILHACEELSQLSRCRDAFIYFPNQRFIPIFIDIFRRYFEMFFKSITPPSLPPSLPFTNEPAKLNLKLLGEKITHVCARALFNNQFENQLRLVTSNLSVNAAFQSLACNIRM